MKARKIANLIIVGLSITFTIILVKLYVDIKNFPSNDETKIGDTILLDKRIFINTLNKVNKLIVLDGSVNIKANYSNKNIADDDVNFVWLKNWLEDISSKDLNISADYNFSFVYDLEDLPIEIVDNIPQIHISKNRLSLTVQLNENKTFYSDRVGFLENDFTPQEINSINARTKELVYNKVINDEELRNKAFSGLKNNIDKLLGVECKYLEADYDVLVSKNEIDIIRN